MPKDLTIVMEDRPGQLAMLGEALGKAKVNVEGGFGFTSMGRGTIHLLLEDKAVESAKRALQQGGLMVQSEQDVLVGKIEDQPGAMGKMARKLADAGVNITMFYLATNTRAVLGVSDMQKAKRALGG